MTTGAGNSNCLTDDLYYLSPYSLSFLHVDPSPSLFFTLRSLSLSQGDPNGPNYGLTLTLTPLSLSLLHPLLNPRSLSLVQGAPDGPNYGLTDYTVGSPEYTAFLLMQTSPWRASAYKWCTNGCLGVVSVTSYDSYDTAVNGEFHQVR